MTTTTTPATTARSITTEVRRALRLAGKLDHVLKVSTQESIDNRRNAAGRVEQVRTWRTLVETFSHTKDVADALTAAGYTVFSKSEQPGSQQFVALTAPRAAEVDTTSADEIAADDYRGDDAALATDLRITEGNLARADRAPALRAEDRRYRAHLLRTQAARAAVDRVVAELSAPDRFQEREALSTLAELSACHRGGVVPIGGTELPFWIVREFLALGVLVSYTTPNRGVRLTDLGRGIVRRLSAVVV